jgi:poly(A) polymerase
MQPAGRMPLADWMDAEETQAVMSALAAGGATARFVGGVVRNALIGEPVQDIDIAADATPEQNMAALKRAGIHVLPTGLKHGTVMAVRNGKHFEITSLRIDVETFGRHANVAYTDDWEADARRRDFTMNALFADIDGTFYDPAGGLADLRAGRVRFVGDPAGRIEEDYLRILRFFRFHAWYGRATPDAAALQACRDLAAGVDGLSGERIRNELLRLLAAPAPLAAVRLLAEFGVLARVLADGFDIGGLARLLRVDDDVEPLRRLAALMRGDGAAVERLARRWHLSKAQRLRLAAIRSPAIDITGCGDAAGLRAALYSAGRQPVVDLALLAGAPDLADRARSADVPEFPLKGRDAVALGVDAGPGVGELLQAVEAWWVAGDFAVGVDELEAELARRARIAGQLSKPAS